MNKSDVIVLGDGFLGNAFKRAGYTVWGRKDFNWKGPNFPPEYLIGRIKGNIKVVINTIGISDTRFCEDDDNWDLIHSVNGELPGYLSRICVNGGVKLVHISTGCLYDRNDGVPQKETAFKAAHCNYVVSKWIGELGCDPEHDLIIRPRLLFDSERPAKGRNNLIVKMEQFTQFLSEYNTVTSLDTIVEAVEALVDAKQSGVFNVGQTGRYTIAEMASYLGFEVECELSQEDLHESQGLYLVNNLMDLSKLQQFYQPRDTLQELERCWTLLQMEGE